MRDFLHRPLPPTKLAALDAMSSAPVVGSWNGEWFARDGRRFNTHSIFWCVSSGLATFNRNRTEARITRAGIMAAQAQEFVA